MKVQFRSAVLLVRDLAAARRFYEGLLGQTVLIDHGPNVGFAGGFALWQADHAATTVGEGWEPAAGGHCGHGELYFECDDLDAAWAALAETDAPVAHPIREQPWGQRVLRVYDPDGHMVELGEPMDVVVRRFLAAGLDVEAVAARTAMPPAVIAQLARTREGAVP
jgi:catechol 2,3-dioxygenase-like lactoylglutathione lyase family enzyme